MMKLFHKLKEWVLRHLPKKIKSLILCRNIDRQLIVSQRLTADELNVLMTKRLEWDQK